MYIDVIWHKYPENKPFSLPGDTVFYVTRKDHITGAIDSKISVWNQFDQKFKDEDVIAWAYIPHANAYIPKEA